MSTDSRTDLPPVSSPNFLEKVRELLSTYLGNRGDLLNRGVTLRDLTDSGIVTLRPGFLSNGGRIAPIGGIGSAISGAYEPDLTPPPTPSGFAATAAISNVLVESGAQTYTQGHGHAKSVLYGASWVSGPLPVFADAVVLEEFSGTVASHATNPATTWHLWLKWVSVDGVASTTPAGGTNGVVATTGQDVSKMVSAMTGTGNPFSILEVDTVIDGVTYPAGTYSTKALIFDAQISNAKIKNLAVDDAKIASLSAAKLTAGSIAVGQYIQSTSYVPSTTGWRINGDGNAEFSGVVVRGTVYASAGQIGGNTIDTSGMQSATYAAGVSGWRLASDGTGQIGGLALGTSYIQSSNYVAGSAGWKLGNNGTLEASSGTFRGVLGAATGTFAGSLSAATGTFSGALSAASGTFAGSLSAASGTFAGTLTAGAVNAVNTINIAGNAVTASNSSTGPGSAGTNIYVPSGQTMKILGLAICSTGITNGGNYSDDLTVILNGTTYTQRAPDMGPTGASDRITGSASIMRQIDVAGPATVSISASTWATATATVIIFGMMR